MARILRCQGRLSNSTLPYSAKHPALLLKDHKFAELFVKGMSSTSTSPRSEIYAHGNQITDVDTARQAICEKDFTWLNGPQEIEGPHYKIPAQADLTSFRVSNPAWSAAGVDYA